MERVLIAGGSGLIGTQLSRKLLEEGYEVMVLSRRARPAREGLQFLQWNPQANQLPLDALEQTDYLVNLSGANVAGKRWTPAYKQEILKSRTLPSRLLAEKAYAHAPRLKKFINASAIGYYGYDRGEEGLTEESAPGSGFLAEVTQAWEEAALHFPDPERLFLPRIGVVLSRKGGALEKMLPPIQWGIGSPLGSGRQWMAWIDIDDMVNILLEAMRRPDWHGPFNAVAPQPERNAALMRKLARHLGKPFFFPPVPGFVLRTVLGEFAESVLGGLKVQPARLEAKGFNFAYSRLDDCWHHLFPK